MNCNWIVQTNKQTDLMIIRINELKICAHDGKSEFFNCSHGHGCYNRMFMALKFKSISFQSIIYEPIHGFLFYVNISSAPAGECMKKLEWKLIRTRIVVFSPPQNICEHLVIRFFFIPKQSAFTTKAQKIGFFSTNSEYNAFATSFFFTYIPSCMKNEQWWWFFSLEQQRHTNDRIIASNEMLN